MGEASEHRREQLLAQAQQDLTAAISNTDLVLEADRANLCLVCGGSGPFRGVCVDCWERRLTEEQRGTVVQRAVEHLRHSPLPTVEHRRLVGKAIRHPT